MEAGTFLQNVWFLLIGVLLAGYSVLDGFDLGIGVLFPFLAKTEDEKRALLGAIGPVWDGNEVWLLAGGGALFAAFPLAYATVFSGFYLALMLVLFALILRAVSLEFRAHDPARKGLWEAVFVGSSLVPALPLRRRPGERRGRRPARRPGRVRRDRVHAFASLAPRRRRPRPLRLSAARQRLRRAQDRAEPFASGPDGRPGSWPAWSSPRSSRPSSSFWSSFPISSTGSPPGSSATSSAWCASSSSSP